MSEIVLVRQEPTVLTEEENAAARRAFFGVVDGLGERGKRQWRRLWNRMMKLEPGEMIEIKTHQARLGWYHRKHMALEQAVFQSQERFENFEGFRDWLKVGAGHCQWYPGPKGGIFPVPDSTSYSNLEQGQMETVHANMVAFLRTEHAGKTLWKHLQPMARVEMIESVLGDFHE